VFEDVAVKVLPTVLGDELDAEAALDTDIMPTHFHKRGM